MARGGLDTKNQGSGVTANYPVSCHLSRQLFQIQYIAGQPSAIR
jgi:hypothetical protein